MDLESPESSTPIITRAVAAGLMDRYAASYPLSFWQKTALSLLGCFPQGAARWVIPRFDACSSLEPRKLAGITSTQLIKNRLKDYGDLSEKVPAVIIGAGLGGASAHLALALGGPFLPQAFVFTLKGGSTTGCAQAYLDRSYLLALNILEYNQDFLAIQHYDPVHDGWMTQFVNHLRLKLISLPEIYKRYILDVLEPGGAICYLDCQAQWLRYRIGSRHVFQVGGWGDIPPEEFINGSQRLNRFAEKSRISSDHWRLNGLPLEPGAESEWGCEPGLDAALEEFCYRHKFRFIHIHSPDPHAFSKLAFFAQQRLLEISDRSPAGVFIEMFSQFDATAIRRSGLLPLWLVFNTADSLKFLLSMRAYFPAQKPIFFSPLSTFSLTPDLVPWNGWSEALAGFKWYNIGSRKSHYPADPWALAGWAEPLRRWAARHPAPITNTLLAEELAAISETMLDSSQ